MKKTYIAMSVFCLSFIMLCGCGKTSYFEAKEGSESKTQVVEEEFADDTNVSETEEPTSTNVYVYIYPKEGYESVVTSESIDVADYSGKINLNTASVSELMNLPGIGESKAEAIISYRSEKGTFSKVEDLMQIPGIKEGVYSKIKDLIYVN